MRGFRLLGSVIAIGALAASPALAQRHGDHRHHHDHDRIDAGDVALGAVLGGGLIALLAGSHHDDAEYASPPDYGYDSGETDGDDGAPPPDTFTPPDYTGSRAETPEARDREGAAVDACAASAEAQGRHYARVAHVESVSDVHPAGAQAWLVNGTISLRDDYRDDSPQVHGFRCSISTGGVQDLRIDGVGRDS